MTELTDCVNSMGDVLRPAQARRLCQKLSTSLRSRKCFPSEASCWTARTSAFSSKRRKQSWIGIWADRQSRRIIADDQLAALIEMARKEEPSR
jgi:hypothetical protein